MVVPLTAPKHLAQLDEPSCSKSLQIMGFLSPVFLRLIMFIYRNQCCDVRWNESFSNKFSVSNGVRQGTVSSPILFCIYVVELIQEMRLSGSVCIIGGRYLGLPVYADDIILLNASINRLQSMCQGHYIQKSNASDSQCSIGPILILQDRQFSYCQSMA